MLVRTDAARRGKGHALAFAFERCLADGFCDAVVVIDADTVVSKNLLSAFAARLARGASALQAEYGVRNPGSSWRTRLMTIALAAFHGVRSVARERLGVSCGLRGNGMAFSKALLLTNSPRAFSIVEDLEYGIQLGLRRRAGRVRARSARPRRHGGHGDRLAVATSPLGARAVRRWFARTSQRSWLERCASGRHAPGSRAGPGRAAARATVGHCPVAGFGLSLLAIPFGRCPGAMALGVGAAGHRRTRPHGLGILRSRADWSTRPAVRPGVRGRGR